MNQPTLVFRSIALPVPTFDYLKQFQREYKRLHNACLSNSQALAIILDQHKQFAGVLG